MLLCQKNNPNSPAQQRTIDTAPSHAAVSELDSKVHSPELLSAEDYSTLQLLGSLSPQEQKSLIANPEAAIVKSSVSATLPVSVAVLPAVTSPAEAALLPGFTSNPSTLSGPSVVAGLPDSTQASLEVVSAKRRARPQHSFTANPSNVFKASGKAEIAAKPALASWAFSTRAPA